MTQGPPLKYLVLSDHETPFLLARVRFPDVAQAISPGCSEWLEDVGLFDLPYEPTAITVSYARAAEIAAEWGASMPAEDCVEVQPRSFIRWMPASWSELAPAERRAWSITRPVDKGAQASERVAAYWRRSTQFFRSRSTRRDIQQAPVAPVPSSVNLAAVTDANGGGNS